MKTKLLVFFLFNFFLMNAFAQTTVHTKSKKKDEVNPNLIVEVPLSYKGDQATKKTVSSSAEKKTNLQKLKADESEKKWEDCASLAQREFASQKLIKDWIMATWLHCSLRSLDEHRQVSTVQAVLKTLEDNRFLMLAGPAKNQIFQDMVKIRLLQGEILDKSESKKEFHLAKENIEILLSYGDKLEKESQAKALYLFAMLAQNNHQLRAEKQFLEESLSQKESRAAREKLNSVLLALGEHAPETKENNMGLALPEAEKKAEERLDQSLNANDLITYVEDGVSYLNKYPNGRRAKTVQDKIIEIYWQIFDHINNANENEIEKFTELQERTLVLMEKAEPLRQLEWAKTLHRKGDFSGSLRLVEKSVNLFSKSMQSGYVLWLQGRSAHLSGQYSKAQKAFEHYIESNSGGDEYSEVLLRLALVYLREHQYSSAVVTLEKLLLSKNLDRYELTARYWLVRALQAEKNDRAQTEIASLIEKFPFSYYGIRLRAEQNNGTLDWASSANRVSVPDASYYLTGQQKKTEERIQLLSVNGWFAEAQKEIAELPAIKDPVQKILLAKKWLGAKAYPMVIKLINEAGDADNKWRALDVISMSFPNEFDLQVQREATKNQLNPILIRSLIRQESAFGMRAISSSNALGLMQLIPPTASEVAQDLRLGKINIPDDVFEPDLNIQLGSNYLAKMIKKFGGSVPFGLAAYNAGPQRMQTFVMNRPEVANQLSKASSDPFDEMWIDELPWLETSFYVKAILRNSLVYKTLEKGKITLDPVIWSDLVLGRDSAHL